MSDNPLYYHNQGPGDPSAQGAPTENGQSAMQSAKDSFMSSKVRVILAPDSHVDGRAHG